MLEPLILAVSGVLKAWHVLYTGLTSVSPSSSWLLSIISLLVTVRALIAPLSIKQYVIARQSANLRPDIDAIRRRYRHSGDPLAPAYQQWAIADLQRSQNISLSGALTTPLIQLPVIIGLYSLLRRIVHAGPHGVGFLSTAEVSEFATSELLGVPLSASMSMPSTALAQFATSRQQVVDVILPLIVCAALFTTINLAVSLRRYGSTYDYSRPFARRMSRFMLVMLFVSPIFILTMGVFGKVALALIIYWVCNNLWTLIQNVLLTIYIERKYPLSEKFIHHRSSQRIMERRRISIARRKRHLTWRSSFSAPARAELAELQKQHDDEVAAEAARNLKVQKFRFAVALMRPREQHFLPDLCDQAPIATLPQADFTVELLQSSHVFPIPQRTPHSRVATWLRKKKSVQYVMWAGRSLAAVVKKKTLAMRGREESQWKRFRK
ncbi:MULTISPECIES: membrane protein insertase YidC [unclassified Corynebacterium]|uniref:membrane protein insertase YidC n=1 Tax=unclassified Corynebacterium TaxID=2624378 RepID=UPI0030AF7AEF